MILEDCNNCARHIQAVPRSKQPQECFSCVGVFPGKLSNWIPMSKSYDATFREELTTGLVESVFFHRVNPNLPAPQSVFKKEASNGATAGYYELPEGAKELQDLISFKNMNAQMGEIFRAVYRYGQVNHSPEIRDIKKIIFYANEELKRLEKYVPQSA